MKATAREAVFGAFDGTTSALGVICAVGLGAAHTLLAAATGLAVASAVGMAGGDYLSDNGRGWPGAATIGAATGIGTMVPALPLTVGHGTAPAVVTGVLVGLTGAAIAIARGGGKREWALTFGILAVASGASIATSALLGGGG